MTMTDLPPTPPPPPTPDQPPATDPAPTGEKRGRGRPKGSGKTDAAPRRRVGRPSTDDKLREKVAEMYGAGALGLMLVDPALATRVMDNADALADAWIKLAGEYPRVRTLLERITTTSAIGAFLAVHFRVFGPTLLDKAGGLGGLGALFGVSNAPAPAPVIPGPWPTIPTDDHDVN